MIKELFSSLFPVLFIFLCIASGILWAKAIEKEYSIPPKKPDPPKYPVFTKEDFKFLDELAESTTKFLSKKEPKEPKHPERPPEPMN